MMGRPVKVLHLVRSMNEGGVEHWLMNALRSVDRERFRFHFCALSGELGTFAPEIESLGGRVIPLRRSKNLPAFYRRFRGLLREGQYDVVHAHPFYSSGHLLRLAALERPAKLIAHSHVTSDGRASTPARMAYRWLMKRWINRHATHGLAACRAAAEALFGPRWESDPRFRILYCGVNLDAFRQPVDRAAVLRELGIPGDAPVIGHVGRFHYQKNHEGLVAIAEIIMQSRPQARFVLVGDGPLRPGIERLVQQRGIADQFVFCGVRTDIPRLYAAMDVLLLPSRYEGVPLVLMEAQAAGLPIVASEIPGVWEAVAAVEINHVFPLASHEEAAAAVIKRLGSRAPSGQPLDPRVEKFVGRFDIRRTIRELERIYDE